MTKSEGRTRNFRKRISIEREVLAVANEASEASRGVALLGLSEASIQRWVKGLECQLSERQVRPAERALKELSRATGLLADESRCAVAEGKVSSDFPNLLAEFKLALAQLDEKSADG
ncbi:MAG: hypothetical protein HWE26_16225 [Alteromonadaceae bacterium]|nr:hypothetical protein [Alteromonadaceae bacterium]